MSLSVDDRAWYLAGPMTGIPQFNFPLFEKAADELRNFGLRIISPAEMDVGEVADAAVKSPDGELIDGQVGGQTWGDLLARDVKIIADTCQGVIFLPNWEKSKGARLEAYVGILGGHNFARYVPGGYTERMTPQTVLTMLARVTYKEIRNA